MIGAARFELDLALLDASFLNPEFGKGRLHTGNCQPRRRDENRQRYLSLVVLKALQKFCLLVPRGHPVQKGDRAT
jgi:hypothetical protein